MVYKITKSVILVEYYCMKRLHFVRRNIYQEVGQDSRNISYRKACKRRLLIIHIKIIFAFRYLHYLKNNDTLHIWYKKRKRLVVPVGDGSDESSIFMRSWGRSQQRSSDSINVRAYKVEWPGIISQEEGMVRLYSPLVMIKTMYITGYSWIISLINKLVPQHALS